MAKKFKRSGGRFVQLDFSLLKHPEWISLSPTAKTIYIALKARFNGSNNGQIFAPQAELAKDTGLRRETVSRNIGTLEKAGFIRTTERGYLGLSGHARASRYALTELPIVPGKPAPRDYAKKKNPGAFDAHHG